MRFALPLIVSAGCLAPPNPDSSITCEVDTSDHPRASALQAAIDEPVAAGIPGIALAVQTPEGIWQGAAGFADIERRVRMTPCHVHPWASVGKTWHAALALRLVDAGLLDLDRPLSAYLSPEVLRDLPNTDTATLRQVMQHASGLADFNDDLGYLIHEFNDMTTMESPEELLDQVRGKPALFEPGAGYNYSDTAYVLLALVIDAITGDRVAAMHDEVLAPLNLQHTSLPLAGDPDPEGRVNSYWEITGGRLENVSDLQAQYDVQVIGAGNLRSTPAESLAFISALTDGTLLSPSSQDALVDWSEASERDDGFAYGLGIQRLPRDQDGASAEWVGHFGGDVGAAAVLIARPDTGAAIAGAVNLGGFLGGPLNALVGDAFLAELQAATE